MTIEDRVEELDTRHTLAEQISKDQFGNDRIAALNKLEHRAEGRFVKVEWLIYTVDSNGENIVAPNLTNPYKAHQAATDGVRVDPTTGQRVNYTAFDYTTKTRVENEQEANARNLTFDSNISDEDLATLLVEKDYEHHISITVSQYEYFTGAIKSKQAHYYDFLSAFLAIDDAKGLI